jgi:predicted nucleic acid-binding protein
VADVWVVDASPLIALAHADNLELLEKLPADLVVPMAVVEEILAGPDDPARRALSLGWGPRQAATVPERVAEWGLGKGESAVLTLAIELEATAVLDDRNARRSAKALGVSVIGTLGVIIRAKKHGLIAAAQPVIRSVVDAGLYYDDHAIQTLLSSVGESWPDLR